MKAFLGLDGLSSMFVWSLSPGHSLHSEQGFRKEGIAKTMFSQKHVFGDSRVEFWCCSGGPGAGFSDFFCLGNRLEN